jgi:hypothetical protein
MIQFLGGDEGRGFVFRGVLHNLHSNAVYTSIKKCKYMFFMLLIDEYT